MAFFPEYNHYDDMFLELLEEEDRDSEKFFWEEYEDDYDPEESLPEPPDPPYQEFDIELPTQQSIHWRHSRLAVKYRHLVRSS